MCKKFLVENLIANNDCSFIGKCHFKNFLKLLLDHTICIEKPWLKMLTKFNQEDSIGIIFLDFLQFTSYGYLKPLLIPVEEFLEQVVQVNFLNCSFWKLIHKLLVKFCSECLKSIVVPIV